LNIFYLFLTSEIKYRRILKSLLTLLLGLTGFFAFGNKSVDHGSAIYERQGSFMNFNVPADSSSKALKRKENKRAITATVMSAILPGAGQVYNRKYWKVPVIYGAMAGLGYFFIQNQGKYKKYHTALLYRYDDDPNTVDDLDKYTDENLITLKTQYRKYRDLSALGIAVVYVFNIIDANVDAHLYKFEQKISDDVSLRLKPYNSVCIGGRPQVYNGLTLQLKFR
jgi:hypothetical protein